MTFNLRNFGDQGKGNNVQISEARAEFECIPSFRSCSIPRPNCDQNVPYQSQSNNRMVLIQSTHDATAQGYRFDDCNGSNHHLHQMNLELENSYTMTFHQNNTHNSSQIFNAVDVLTQLLSEDACATKQQAERKYMQKSYHEAPPRPNIVIATPTNNDVLLGRGGLSNNHPGNKMFRSIVHRHKGDYIVASKAVKPRIARRIVHALRNTTTLNPPCRFLKKCPTQPNMWFDVGDREFIMKTSQTLRDKGVKNDESDIETLRNVEEIPENVYTSNQSHTPLYEIDAPYHLSWDRKGGFSPHPIPITVTSSISEHQGPSSTEENCLFNKVASSIKPVIDNVNDDDVTLLEENVYFQGVNLSTVDGLKRRRSLDSEESDSFECIQVEKKICIEHV